VRRLQQLVDQLYSRWVELENKLGPTDRK